MAIDAFQGVAQPVPEGKYATTANEMPKFMQDAIYNQIQIAQNIANNTPYQEYNMPLVAEATPDQQQAYADVRANQGMWQPGMELAQQGMAQLAQQPGQAAAAQPYFEQVAGMSGVGAAQPALQQQANLLGGINYNAPTSTLDARQNQYLNPDLANYALQQAQNAYGTAGTIDIAGAASPYIQRAASMSGLENAQGLMAQQASLLGSLNYNNPAANLYSAQNEYLNRDLANAALQSGQKSFYQAGQQDISGSADPYLSQQMGVLNALNYNAPTENLAGAQNKYLSPDLAQEQLVSGKQTLGSAANINAAAAAQPYLNQQMGVLNALNYNAPTENLAAAQNKYLSPDLAQEQLVSGKQTLGKAVGLDATGAAQPYLEQAAQTSAAGINQYMNPYQEGVMNALAKQSSRNLSENLLPAVSDAFIRAGQFGGTRMGEFGSRAVRDTQEALLNQQAQALQQGYGQALTASQADLARQAQLASTAGQLTGQQQAALTNIGQAQTAAGQAQQQTGLTAAQNVANAQAQAIAQAQQTASQMGQVGAQQGQLTSQQQSALANIGQAQLASGQAQQQTGLTAAQNIANAQAQAIAQAQQTASQMGQVGAQRGQLTAQEMAAQTNLGQAQTAAGQVQQQAGLTAAQQVANAQAQALSQAQASAAQYGALAGQVGSMTAQQQQTLANLGQTAGQLTGQQAANIMNVGQAQAALGLAQQQAGLGAAQNIANAQQQAISAQMQGASQYGQLGAQMGALTADQQKILAGLGTSGAGFASGDINTQMSALSNIAQLAQAQQGAAARDAAALSGIGQEQQANMQQQLNAAYQQYQQGQQYPMQMADWLSTQIRGMAPITPQMTTQNAGGTTVQYGASPLSQIAGAYATYKGLTS